MGPVKRILGHVKVEKAKRRRQCVRNKNNHTIQKNENCLAIKDPGWPGWRSYCKTCGKEILDRATTDLVTLQADLV